MLSPEPVGAPSHTQRTQSVSKCAADDILRSFTGRSHSYPQQVSHATIKKGVGPEAGGRFGKAMLLSFLDMYSEKSGGRDPTDLRCLSPSMRRSKFGRTSSQRFLSPAGSLDLRHFAKSHSG